ncbi:MAG: formyl transferase [Gammaproteobacteria bacterium]|nr:formyl transferase [Gammaproteobacteria bacterium]
MNITFLVNHDLPSVLALNYLVPQLDNHALSIFYSRKPALKHPPPSLINLIAFETRSLASLNNSSGASGLLGFAGLERYACRPVSEMNAVNGRDLQRLQRSNPALIVSIRHMTILHEPVIYLPEHGVINLHSGLLPAYQGVMASFRAMLNGEKLLGSSLHYIEDQSIDKGGLIGRARVACRYDKSYLWNVLNLYQSGCLMVLDTIKTLAENQPVNCHNQLGQGNYFTFPDASDLATFNDAGYRLHDDSDLSDFFI